MKLLFLSNNPVSAPLAEWLKPRTDFVMLEEKLTLAHLEQIKPDLVVSYSYGHLLGKALLDMLPDRFVNLHISFLPYNRGADPNAWSFLEDSPKGVSIHLIDPGIDTGKLLLQKQVRFDEARETLAHSYQALQNEIQSLFRENWGALRDRKIKPVSQVGTGSYHNTKDFNAIKEQLMGVEGWDVPIPLFKERYRQLMSQTST